MIDIRALEKGGLDAYKTDLKNRGGDPAAIEQLVVLNTKRRKLINDSEVKKAEQNKVTQEIAQLKRKGEDASKCMEDMKKLVQEIKILEETANAVDQEVHGLSLTFPNRLHKDVPVGKSSDNNLFGKPVGSPKKFSFKPIDHTELGENLEGIFFERAGKIAGARFAVLQGPIAKLERSLINFMLETHTKNDRYKETLPPFIVNSSSLIGTGQLPKFKEDLFHLENTDYYLIPTAEVPVTNYFRDEILDADRLPISFCAYTPCFRSEAGNYGKDTKGLIRQHQFNKVELVKFVHPEESYAQHEQLTKDAEKILEDLELPYRRVTLCSGDIGFAAAKCYDLEVWLPSQNTYREISSCSNFEDFQARRANIRFREKGGKPQFVHTLNGSGLAVGRTLVAILENYQEEDGSISIPKALQSYFGKEKIERSQFIKT